MTEGEVRNVPVRAGGSGKIRYGSRKGGNNPAAQRYGATKTAQASEKPKPEPFSGPKGTAYRRTLTMILRICPSPTIGAWPSSGSSIVNWPGRSV